MQPVPRPVVCTVPLHATVPPPPSTRRHHHRLRATPAASMCHRRSHHWPLPLHAAPPLSVAFVHAPRAARAPRGTHGRHPHLARVHTSHTGPCATPLFPPCLGPVRGPIRGHVTRSRDRVRVAFMCHWVAHMHRESMGDCTYTLDTVYEHV